MATFKDIRRTASPFLITALSLGFLASHSATWVSVDGPLGGTNDLTGFAVHPLGVALVLAMWASLLVFTFSGRTLRLIAIAIIHVLILVMWVSTGLVIAQPPGEAATIIAEPASNGPTPQVQLGTYIAFAMAILLQIAALPLRGWKATKKTVKPAESLSDDPRAVWKAQDAGVDPTIRLDEPVASVEDARRD